METARFAEVINEALKDMPVTPVTARFLDTLSDVVQRYAERLRLRSRMGPCSYHDLLGLLTHMQHHMIHAMDGATGLTLDDMAASRENIRDLMIEMMAVGLVAASTFDVPDETQAQQYADKPVPDELKAAVQTEQEEPKEDA